jgi:Protein of unknown function (DUF3300)
MVQGWEHLKMLKNMRLRLLAIAPAVLAFLVLLPFAVMAQTPNPPPASSQELLKPQEMEALVAPIALYPDTLLAEVLMASTYPLEVVQADRWLTANKNLKEDQFKAAVDKQPWDGSVKALVATPSVLTMMSSKLDWTQKLGDAFDRDDGRDPAPAHEGSGKQPADIDQGAESHGPAGTESAGHCD